MTENYDFQIRPATEQDVPSILDVLRTANMHNVPSLEMPELDWKCYFVAVVRSRIVGIAGYKILSNDEAKTTLMVVYPEFRRYGIGKALQEKRMRVLAEKGIKTLTTNSDIPETIEWYKKHFGYIETGEKIAKLHEFGRPDIHEWTTLKTDLQKWSSS